MHPRGADCSARVFDPAEYDWLTWGSLDEAHVRRADLPLPAILPRQQGAKALGGLRYAGQSYSAGS